MLLAAFDSIDFVTHFEGERYFAGREGNSHAFD
jgi:hypothetical protein